MTEWIERNGFIPIPTQSLTDDEIQVLKGILGGTGMTNDEAIGVLEDMRDAICENIPGNHSELDELREAVQMAVNALVERKTGKWIRGDAEKLTGSQRCSICHKACYKGKDSFNYCPNCGAEMDCQGD